MAQAPLPYQIWLMKKDASGNWIKDVLKASTIQEAYAVSIGAQWYTARMIIQPNVDICVYVFKNDGTVAAQLGPAQP